MLCILQSAAASNPHVMQCANTSKTLRFLEDLQPLEAPAVPEQWQLTDIQAVMFLNTLPECAKELQAVVNVDKVTDEMLSAYHANL